MSNRYLVTALRRVLEKAVKDARVVAEEGARDAIRRLGVADAKAPSYLSDAEKDLRRRLRAHARALGDTRDRSAETQETKRLIEAAAYAHWHRMLFARFLGERGLLRNPEHDVAVTLEDCRELAESEGLSDAWAVAERYAAAMLPAVFRVDDPVLALDLDPGHTQKLNRLVMGLDPEVFQAEDSLGWTYQFWRAAEKDSVNASGVKIGVDELPAVTQLFTEPYMVRFLLHNTLGAWWASKVLVADATLAATAADENALRSACALPGYSFDMLRFSREGSDGAWRPAAGAYLGWPKEARAITMLDPCCGSGHFLTEALAILAALRNAEEGLSLTASVAAVLRDNLYGLEIDGRCVQIAAFAVALTAWRFGGWQTLPLPHIAWVGAPPPLPKREFVALAEGNSELEYALAALHDLFAQAPLLGSLIEPVGGDLFDAERMREIERLLESLLDRARRAEPERQEGVIAARGMSDAAAILARRYTLQATNVPFLGRGKQGPALADYIGRFFPDAKSDLATAMLSRVQRLAVEYGTLAAVTPQNWLFLGSYKGLRRQVLRQTTLNAVAVIGEHGFDSVAAAGAFTALIVFSVGEADTESHFAGLDAHGASDPTTKATILHQGNVRLLGQKGQLGNPDSRIAVAEGGSALLLQERAASFQGIKTGDDERYRRLFWEFTTKLTAWRWFQSTVDDTIEFGGRQSLVRWGSGGENLARKQGLRAFGKSGVAVSQMRDLPVTIFTGEAFDSNVGPIIPQNEKDILALWAFCSSDEYKSEIRRIDRKVAVANATLVKVPFDLAHWQKVGAKRYPSGLPEPYSDDPTQWLFHGHPAKATLGTAVHVSLARLLGYRWPAETDHDLRLSDEARVWIAKAVTLPEGSNDGVVSVPAVAGEKPLADHLRAHLAGTFGADWSDALERRLIAEADELLDKKTVRDGSLETWLRDRAFRQHCALFGQRPFLWHISDGLKDGFSVFVHYHRFDQGAMRKLTYTMLGDWLARAKSENNTLRHEKGRVLQQKLEKVLEGEVPYDIFVRWKSLARQPVGWDPDLDDGVRMNIRPVVEAGILHDTPKIKWTKDRGTDESSAPWHKTFKGERINDHHTSLAEKRAAREAVAKRVGGTG